MPDSSGARRGDRIFARISDNDAADEISFRPQAKPDLAHALCPHPAPDTVSDRPLPALQHHRQAFAARAHQRTGGTRVRHQERPSLLAPFRPIRPAPRSAGRSLAIRPRRLGAGARPGGAAGDTGWAIASARPRVHFSAVGHLLQGLSCDEQRASHNRRSGQAASRLAHGAARRCRLHQRRSWWVWA